MAKRKYVLIATTYDKRGRVIARGKNSYAKTHPLQMEYAERAGQDFKSYLHAEIHAIIRSRGADIHKIKIERYGQNGEPKMARPCAVCELAIKTAGIRFVEYTVG